MRTVTVAFLCGFLAAAGLFAQGEALTVDQIVQLIKEGVSEDLIVEKLRLDGCDCRATAMEIMILRGADASDALIREVIASSSRAPRRIDPTPDPRPTDPPDRDFPRAEVSSGANWLRFESGESLWGWQMEGQGNVNRWIGFFGEFSQQPGKLEFRDPFSGITLVSLDINVLHLHGGPKATFRNNAVTGFVRGGVGFTRVSIDDVLLGIVIKESATGFSWVAGGGLDVNVTPGLAIRVIQADYLGFRAPDIFGSTTVNNFRLSFGVVFKVR